MFREARLESKLPVLTVTLEAGIGARSLYRYEDGEHPMPPEVALKLAELYRKPELTHFYCSKKCPIGQAYCYNVTKKDIGKSALGLLGKFEEVKQNMSDLIMIVSDGIIDSDEQFKYRQILSSLMGLEKQIENLKLSSADIVDISKMVKDLEEKEKTSSYATARG